jgi:hypothetical protein
VIGSFMRPELVSPETGVPASYDVLPLDQKIEWEETRVLEMQTLDDPAPLNTFQAARSGRARGRLVVWAGFSVTLLALLLIVATKPHDHEEERPSASGDDGSS